MSNESKFSIESDDLTIDQIFNDFYMVPDFQREYVWETEHVEKLLQDVFDEFYDEENRLVEGPEYFLGSIVVCGNEGEIFQLIDGQQRMTTIYTVLCVGRDMLEKNGETAPDWLKSNIRFVTPDPVTGDDVERQRLTLQYEDSDGILEKLVVATTPVADIAETTQSVKKILSAYRTVEVFLNCNLTSDPARIKKFLLAFTKRIKLIRIKTPSITNALKVFETINDRGVGLNAMDLLKNLLFMKTSQDDYPKLKTRWKELVDILDGCNEKPLRFLRYYIMANHDIDYHKGLREDEIYEWFVFNAEACGINSNPLQFVNQLTASAKAHANFIGSKDVQGEANRYLSNISFLGGAIRQQYILLLAAQHLSVELFSRLAQAIENLFFCYIITREPTKTFERNFARWSKDLRQVTDDESLTRFLGKYFLSDMRQRIDRFEFSLEELTQWSIQKYRLRYILAKITQYIEEQAWGNPAHSKLEQYITKTVEIEHILPQNPEAEVKEKFDKGGEYYQYVGRLGNLTLLEKTINGSISNGAYEDKVSGYKESAFLLTKSLAEKPQVGANTQLNRAVKDLKSFDHWDSKAIEDRQMILVKLARQVWGMSNEELEIEHNDADTVTG